MLKIISAGATKLISWLGNHPIKSTLGAAGGIFVGNNAGDDGLLGKYNLGDAAKKVKEDLTENRSEESGVMDAIKGFLKENNITFGAGSLVGAGLLGAVGLFLKEPMLVAGLAAVGALAGQPLMNAIMPAEKGGPKPTVSGAAPKAEPKAPAKTEEPEVEVPAQIPAKPPAEIKR